jgi:hypothetical protein
MVTNTAPETVPESFYCPLTHEVMTDPVVDPEGNTYERSAIETWLKKNTTSPITRTPLSLSSLAPNRALKDLIAEILPNGGAIIAEASTEAIALPSASSVNLPILIPPVPSGIELQLSSSPSVGGGFHVLASLKPDMEGKRTPVDICCVIDVSGSMESEATFQNASGLSESHGLSYLDVVKHAVATIISSLEPSDRLSLVKYSTEAVTVLSLVHMNPEGKAAADLVLKALQTEDSTGLRKE